MTRRILADKGDMVVGSLTLLSAVFSVVFYLDLQGVFDEAVANPIAQLRYAEGTVRRLSEDEFAWSRVSAGKYFARGDYISTGEDASAELHFFNPPSVLHLSEGAMVYLGDGVDELNIGWVTGALEVKVAKKNDLSKVKVVAKPPKKSVALASAPATTPELPKKPRVKLETDENLKVVQAPSAEEIAEVEEFLKDNTETFERTTDELIKKIKETKPQVVREPAAVEAKKVALKKEPLVREVDSESLSDSELRRALAGTGNLISAIGLPPSPVMIDPPGTRMIIADPNQPPPVLRWEWEKGDWEGNFRYFEVGYDITYDDGRKRKGVTKASRNRIVLRKAGNGKYVWWVRAVGKNGKKSEKTEEREFTLKRLASIASPTILAPEEVDEAKKDSDPPESPESGDTPSDSDADADTDS